MEHVIIAKTIKNDKIINIQVILSGNIDDLSTWLETKPEEILGKSWKIIETERSVVDEFMGIWLLTMKKMERGDFSVCFEIKHILRNSEYFIP